MGSVKLPFTGRIYVDVPILIYSVERHPIYAPVLRHLWTAAAASAVQIIVSELAILETMVLPLRLANPALIADYEAFFTMPVIELWPVDRHVLLEGARLRAELLSLRTADAIHAATAKLSGCDAMFTNDVALRQLSACPVYIAQDFIDAREEGP